MVAGGCNQHGITLATGLSIPHTRVRLRACIDDTSFVQEERRDLVGGAVPDAGDVDRDPRVSRVGRTIRRLPYLALVGVPTILKMSWKS